MKPTDQLISCDWGTSSFRLYLVDTATGTVLHQFDNGLGIKALFENWQQSGRSDRKEFFLEYLDFRVQLLARKAGIKLGGIPVFVSGMASASIGMQELPYSAVPFDLSGSDLQYQWIDQARTGRGSVLLWSGIRTSHDVMRGEESQLIGLAPHLGAQRGTVILPGTHSKHIEVRNGQIRDFRTYMTGEFFELLSQYSILKNSLAAGGAHWPHFELGVQTAREVNLLAASFRVRTNELLHQMPPDQNQQYLSGLLIGSELRDLKAEEPVYLCGGGKLQERYQRALQCLEHQAVKVIEAAIVEAAVARAHAAVYRTLIAR